MHPLLPACLFALLAGTHAQAKVNPSRIVKDVRKDCPVNNTLYTEDEFSVSELIGLMTPLVTQGSQDSPCARVVPNLALCALDGTLQVKEGCCSSGCAGKMQQALIRSGRQCYRELIEVICSSTDLRESVSGALFGTARRCLGLTPSCELLPQPSDLLAAAPIVLALAATPQENASNSAATPPRVLALDSTADGAADSMEAKASQQQQQQQHRSNSTPAAAANGTVNSTTSFADSGRSVADNLASSSAAWGNHGLSSLTAAIASLPLPAPATPPDPFMPLVPRPVETASSAVVLATPEEIEAAAGASGARSGSNS